MAGLLLLRPKSFRMHITDMITWQARWPALRKTRRLTAARTVLFIPCPLFLYDTTSNGGGEVLLILKGLELRISDLAQHSSCIVQDGAHLSARRASFRHLQRRSDHLFHGGQCDGDPGSPQADDGVYLRN